MVNQKIKQRAIHRAKIIKGQLDGLIKAIEREDYCTTLLHQSLSIQESLKSLNRLLLENHIRTHVKHQLHGKETEKAIKELMEIYSSASR